METKERREEKRGRLPIGVVWAEVTAEEELAAVGYCPVVSVSG